MVANTHPCQLQAQLNCMLRYCNLIVDNDPPEPQLRAHTIAEKDGTPIQWRHLGRDKPTARGLCLRDEVKGPGTPCASETFYPGGFMYGKPLKGLRLASRRYVHDHRVCWSKQSVNSPKRSTSDITRECYDQLGEVSNRPFKYFGIYLLQVVPSNYLLEASHICLSLFAIYDRKHGLCCAQGQDK